MSIISILTTTALSCTQMEIKEKRKGELIMHQDIVFFSVQITNITNYTELFNGE